MSDSLTRTDLLPASVVEEMLKTLVKALRAFQMYLPNNPIYQKAQTNIIEAFRPIWEVFDELTLSIVETDFVWEDQPVYHQPNKNESLAWTLYKDGMRVLTFKTGAERLEIPRLLEVVHKARMLPADADDDLNTLLWEQQFDYIQYQFTEFLTEGAPIEYTGTHNATPAAAIQEAVHEEVQPSSQPESRPTGIVDIEDFDSTLYFLEEAEIAYIREALEGEYRQDLRTNSLNILLDLLEQQGQEQVRTELFGILDTLMPNLLQGNEFRAVAMVLREVRVIGERVKSLTPEQRQRLENFRSQLSEPTVLTQMLQGVDEATTAPSAEDLGELFRELRPGSLETILVWLPRISTQFVRDLLVQASERLAEASPSEVMRLLRLPESEALMGTVDLCGRLELQGSVAGLTDTLSHHDRAIRLASVRSLTSIGSPGALQSLEKALDDPDREIRIFAVRALGTRGYKNALKRIEQSVLEGRLKDADLTERIAFFEAYALIARDAALTPLTRILIPGGIFRKKHGPDSRACAAIALAKLNTPDARAALELAKEDKDLVVRNAVNRALRESTGTRVPPA